MDRIERNGRVWRMALAALVVVSAVFVAGCNGQAGEPGAAVSLVAAATLQPGEPVPPPSEDVVLTVGGRIETTNGEDALTLDLATLDQLETVSGEVFEPWTKQDLGFQGVRLVDVLNVAELEDDAVTVRLVALDDYIVELSVADLDDSVILATRRSDGSPIPVAEGGPVRVLFVDAAPPLADPNNWIWSLSTVSVL